MTEKLYIYIYYDNYDTNNTKYVRHSTTWTE